MMAAPVVVPKVAPPAPANADVEPANEDTRVEREDCPECKGHGYLEDGEPNAPYVYAVKCDVCEGKGTVEVR